MGRIIPIHYGKIEFMFQTTNQYIYNIYIYMYIHTIFIHTYGFVQEWARAKPIDSPSIFPLKQQLLG